MRRVAPSRNIFLHLNFYIIDNLIGDFDATPKLRQTDFDVEIKVKKDSLVKIEMDNDFSDASGNRNAFIGNITNSKK